MQTIRRTAVAAAGWMMVLVVMLGVLPSHAQTTPAAAPTLMIKIRDVDRMLQDIESILVTDSNATPSSQMAMVKGMLQGTDWIDPSRMVVAGLYNDGPTSSWMVFIPFQTPNDVFQGTYGAVAGEDYYVLRFPPAPDFLPTTAQREALITASEGPSKANILLEIAAHDALMQSEPKIVAAIQNMVATTENDGGQASLTQEEIQNLANDLMDTLKQVQTLRIGFNIDPDTLLLLLDVEAMPDSYLAGLLMDLKADGRLSDYQVDYPMQFRSRAYNVAGAIQMLGATFGQFYRKMGFDFDELAEVAKGLTGEMAGGMALDQGQMRFEMMYVLHDSLDGDDYLSRVYLPWFKKYNQRMAAMMEEQTGQPVTPLYERMPDTAIAGKKVISVRTRFPAVNPAGGQLPAGQILKDYQTLMTSVDNFVLMASSDATIERMISQTAGLKDRAAKGPLAELSMDMGAYLNGLQSIMPDYRETVAIPDDLGNLTMQAEMQAGTLTTRTRVGVQDLQQMVSFFGALSTRMAETSTAPAMDTHEPQQSSAASPKSPPKDLQNTSDYWMDRGGLLSSYGNYQAAAKCYQKALDLAPDLAEAHFQLGVAYGELGRFEAAVSAISRAIDRMPANDAYFYGRARVYLLAGEEELAMKDFMEAGFLGNEDARAYLKQKGVDWN